MLEINLLPIREEKRKADLRQFGLMLGATVVGTVLATSAFHLKLVSDLSGAHEQVAQTQAEIDRFKPQLEQVERYRATKQAIEDKLAVIQRLDRNRSGPVRILDEVSVHAPERLWVTRLEASQGGLSLKGMSLDNELVALFMTALGDSPYFEGVELESTEAKDVDGLRLNAFELSARITMPEESPAAAAAPAAPAATGR